MCINCKDDTIYVLKVSTHQPIINIEKKIICSPIKWQTVVKKKTEHWNLGLQHTYFSSPSNDSPQWANVILTNVTKIQHYPLFKTIGAVNPKIPQKMSWLQQYKNTLKDRLQPILSTLIHFKCCTYQMIITVEVNKKKRV